MRRAASLPVLIAVLTCGCAIRRPPPQLVADLAGAHSLVRAGCYDCLGEALALYERAASSPRLAKEALGGAFEAALLMAMRSKELGLPADAPIGRARAIAAGLAAAAPPAPIQVAMIDYVERLAGELSGLDPEERNRRSLAAGSWMRAEDPRRATLDAGRDASLIAAYLALSLDCERGRVQEVSDDPNVLLRHGGPPLMRYRAATCGVRGAGAPGDIRQADPRWKDTLYFEGRREIDSRAGDPEKGVALLRDAHQAFPQSHAISLALARAHRAVGNYESALATVDRVIAEIPTHRDALAARLENLSYLQRHVEAIATASNLIELGTWHIGDAYYWRAWNRFYLRELDAAWADVEQALTLQSNTTVYALSGFVAHARKQLDTAIQRFDRAFELDGTNCVAAFSAGMVHVEQQAWSPASTTFSRSMRCYTTDAGAARAQLARIDALNDPPARKARLTAAEQKRLASSEQLAAQSAFNAAQCFIRLGERDQALLHVQTAEAHAALRDKAAALRSAIERMR